MLCRHGESCASIKQTNLSRQGAGRNDHHDRLGSRLVATQIYFTDSRKRGRYCTRVSSVYIMNGRIDLLLIVSVSFLVAGQDKWGKYLMVILDRLLPCWMCFYVDEVTHTHTHTHIHTYTHSLHTYTHAYIHTHMHIHIHTRKHTHIHARTQCTHTHTYIEEICHIYI